MTPYHFIAQPAESLQGDIRVPGDKSISHRSIILGSIAQGMTTVSGFLQGADCMATLRAFQSMGVQIEITEPEHLVIHGVGKYGLEKPKQIINCENSGTTMRLLAGLLSAQSFDSVLIGDDSLSKRPMERVSHPLQQMGAFISTSNGCSPLMIIGNQILQGIAYDMPEASAQVKSCLILAGLYAKSETRVTERTLSRDHTERMLKAFSYPINQSGNTITLNGDRECQGTDIVIPGDMSSAAFFIVAATLIPGSELLIRNVGINPTRTGVLSILKQMGANIDIINQRTCGHEWVADLYVRHAVLQGIDIPLDLVSFAIDEFPAILVAASCATGQTILRGACELRFKESDRIDSMAEGLKRLGIQVTLLDDGIIVKGGLPQGGTVDSRGDHRIAMAFAIAGSVASSPVTILDCANVVTSFPTFITTAQTINLQIQEIHEPKSS